ncbi:MAG: Rrf2 family transcriptional regulator [Gemmataceae bacterium]|nr:Rrf2 family transcriptional regulator [Gemmataceae bacterium]
MLVTARAEYACLAMLELASRYGDPKPIPLAEVTDKHGIPQRFLVQILLQMKAAGLVTTTRGSSGGYQLAKSPEVITVADIMGVLDRLEEPDERSIAPSPMATALQKVWKGLAKARSEYLDRYTLSELLPASVELDYSI